METTTIPEKSRADLAIALLLFIASCLYLRLFYNFIYWQHDEGIILQGAARILQGQVLYRDFFSFYTPGTYYWMALLFRVFGTSILVGRAALVVYGGVFSVTTYLLARRVASKLASLLVVFVVTVTCVPQRFVVLFNWHGTLWACLALYAAVRVLEEGNIFWIFATGSLVAITCVFDQTKGGGLTLGLLGGFLLLRMRKADTALYWTREKLSAIVIGFCWPLTGTILYFGLNHALGDMASCLWWPFTHYSTVAQLPYGYVPWWEPAVEGFIQSSWAARFLTILAFTPYLLAAILPLIMPGVLIFRGWRLCGDPRAGRRTEYYVLVSAVGTGLLLALLATHRPDLAHLTFLAPITFLPLAWILGDIDISSPHSFSLYPIGALWVLASVAVCAIMLLSPVLAAHNRIQTRRGVLYSAEPDEVVSYMQRHLAPGQKILAYPILELYYFLTDSYSVSKHEWLAPGLHDANQFNEVEEALAEAQPDVVIFSPDTSESLTVFYPHTPPEAFAARDPVIEYILQHYDPCKVLKTGGSNHVVFMVRKPVGCPHDDGGEQSEKIKSDRHQSGMPVRDVP